jgi:tetratricopeptide (TPR) repeat protein
MELVIKPHSKNTFPLGGLLIKGSSVKHWLLEIQLLALNLEEVCIYPIPNTEPNTVWGCLVVIESNLTKRRIDKHEFCQLMYSKLFIPEKSIVHPLPSKVEIEKLFGDSRHIIHPDFGLAELTEKLNIPGLLIEPLQKQLVIKRPVPAAMIPKRIKSFQVHPLSQEDIIKNLEEKSFPKREKMEDRPLNLLERGRLSFYKLLFQKREGQSKNNDQPIKRTSAGAKAESFFKSLFTKNPNWINQIEKDFEDLEKRNQKQIDRLMDLFQNDPDEALKYAIPLDNDGSNRGGDVSKLELSMRWSDYSLFKNSKNSGSGTINLGDHFYQLQKQYNETAEALVKKNDYEKAAFVYMKLLKNYYKAAETMEAGKHYQQAATIYLKHASNKPKAAECYEKGNMIMDAIELYKELNENEKVGDLYTNISKTKEAIAYYEKVVADYKSKNQYIKASVLYKNKLNDAAAGQELLLDGWKNNKDSTNCLTMYFSNISDIQHLEKEINLMYKTTITEHNREHFLQVLQAQFKNKNSLANSIKEMAYEIVATQIQINPSVVSELRAFNPTNKELMKDTLRFKLKNKK